MRRPPPGPGTPPSRFRPAAHPQASDAAAGAGYSRSCPASRPRAAGSHRPPPGENGTGPSPDPAHSRLRSGRTPSRPAGCGQAGRLPRGPARLAAPAPELRSCPQSAPARRPPCRASGRHPGHRAGRLAGIRALGQPVAYRLPKRQVAQHPQAGRHQPVRQGNRHGGPISAGFAWPGSAAGSAGASSTAARFRSHCGRTAHTPAGYAPSAPGLRSSARPAAAASRPRPPAER